MPLIVSRSPPRNDSHRAAASASVHASPTVRIHRLCRFDRAAWGSSTTREISRPPSGPRPTSRGHGFQSDEAASRDPVRQSRGWPICVQPIDHQPGLVYVIQERPGLRCLCRRSGTRRRGGGIRRGLLRCGIGIQSTYRYCDRQSLQLNRSQPKRLFPHSEQSRTGGKRWHGQKGRDVLAPVVSQFQTRSGNRGPRKGSNFERIECDLAGKTDVQRADDPIANGRQEPCADRQQHRSRDQRGQCGGDPCDAP